MPQFFSRPIVRAALTSGCVMACGDMACQAIQRHNLRHLHSSIDWKRTARFAVIGLTLHGPYFYYAFRTLDKWMGVKATLGHAVKKSLVGQVTVFPGYVVPFFAYMGALEGLSPKQCIEKVKSSVPPTFLTGSIFWPTANVFNFLYVPPTSRVLYVNAMGLLWNSYLSWSNSRYGQLPQLPAMTNK